MEHAKKESVSYPQESLTKPQPEKIGAEEKAGRVLLFTTKTCPNCKTAKKMLQDAGVEYTAVSAEEQPDLVRKYRVMQAPTLVAVTDHGTESAAGVTMIRRMIESGIAE